MDKVIENNQVTVMGEIVSDFSYSHEIFGEGFYMVDVRVQRLSESYDIIHTAHLSPTWKLLAYLALRPQQIQGM